MTDDDLDPAGPVSLVGRRVAVTGASGFVGSRLCARLVESGAEVIAITRRMGTAPCGQEYACPDLLNGRNLAPLLEGCDAVTHLAAVTHAGAAAADTARFHAVNVDGTRSVAESACAAGVPRFVFLSSIKVNGESSGAGLARALSVADAPSPEDDYGRSKLAAERLLETLAGDLSITVLRPPLVYGPGQRGNLQSLMNAVANGWPLPFGLVKNQRSLVHVDNLVDAVLLALQPRSAPFECFTLADVDVSTPGLVRAMARALGVRARLVKVPVGALRFLATLGGRRALASRLTGNLRVDSRVIREVLGWSPAHTLDDGLLAAAVHARRQVT